MRDYNVTWKIHNNYEWNGSENLLRILYYISMLHKLLASGKKKQWGVPWALPNFAVVLKLVTKAEPVK